MADKTAQQKEVPDTEEEVVDKSKSKEPIVVEEESKSENGDSTENGAEEKENGQSEEGEEQPDAVDATEDKVCSIKRKSVGSGEAEAPAEGATPEKKAKLDETTEAESNGEAEVTA